jgi:hypothetical protein
VLRYADIKGFVTEGLTSKGYTGAGLPLLDPGPVTMKRLQMKTPGPMVFLTVGNGIGLSVEALFDLPFIVVRVVGAQNDYTGAETLALDIDALLLGVDTNTVIGATTALYVNRTGGGPQLVDFDSAERYHFQTTYITEVER